MPASIILSSLSVAAAGTAAAASAALVVSATTYAALSFAINFAVSAIITRAFAPSKSGPQDNGVRQQIPPSADNPIPVVYGDAWLAGTFVDAVLSTDQKTMYYVMAISNISPNGQFTYDTSEFYYGDRLIAFDGADQTKVISLTDTAGNVDTKIADQMYVYLYTSNASGVISPVNTAQYPNQVMGGSDIDVALRWPASGRQMTGLAFAIVKLIYSAGDGVTNLQPLTFKVSHALNGTGVAKPGDVLSDYLTNPYYGGAVSASFVNSTACAALNTYSDQTITFTPAGGGSPTTQPRYRINGVVNTGDTVLTNCNHILTACDSWLSYDAATGQWTPVINKAESASLAFDDSNIIGEIKVSVTDLSSTYNQIEVSFPFKGNKDQPEYVRAKVPDGLLFPNEPVNKLSTSFNLVNDSVQASYLANRVLEQSREDLIVTFSSAYPGIQVNAGDVVSVTNSEYGWNAKLFRVMKVSEAALPDGNLGARFDLSEYNAQVYDDFDITQYEPAPNGELASPEYFSALGAPTIAASRPNENPPSFDVQVTLPLTGRITWATLYYTTSATPAAYDWKVLRQASAPQGTAAQNGAIYGWTKVSLPVGAYYFTWIVGNEVGQSARSATSSVFNWSPLDVSGAIAGLEDEVYILGLDIDDKLSKTGANILTGTIVPQDSGGIKSGSITWNSSTGQLTGGSGVAITEAGIIGAQSGVAKFTIDTSGNATFAGDISTDGDAYFAGKTQTATQIFILGSYYNVDYSTFSYATSNATSGSVVRAGTYGYAAASTSALNIGIIGYAPSSTKGVGVFGQGGEYGGYFINSSSGGIAVVASAYSTTNIALAALGRIQWGGTYIYSEPSGSGAFMRDDGSWSYAVRQTPANSGTATVNSSSQISLLGSTSTGIAGAYVGTSASGSTVTWTIQTTSPSDRKLKQDIEDSDLGLAFVNQLQPKKYKLKADPKQQVGYGFIADEVAALGVRDTSLVYHEPDWQVGEETGFDTIHYPSYIAVLTKAIQELSAKVDALQTEIAALKNTP